MERNSRKIYAIVFSAVFLGWAGMNCNQSVAATRPHPGRPLADFVEKNFVGSAYCAACHSALVDRAGRDMSIANHWRSTMMANAAKDPLWQAKVKSEVRRHPGLKNIIEAKCATCHMPMAWTQKTAGKNGHYTDAPVGVFDEFLDRSSALHEAAMDGVSCTLCHQIEDVGLGTAASFSGKYTIDTGLVAPDRPIFGPFPNVAKKIMRTSVGYTPRFGPQVNDSALCATCHTLYTPYVDAAGKVAGVFPEQTVYLEWLHSDYGEKNGKRHRLDQTVENVQLCQDCHMPHSRAGSVIIARYAPPDVKPRDHFSQHHFVGGNVHMMNLFLANIDELKLTASTAKLVDTKNRTLRQLRHKTAKLSFVQLQKKNNRLEIGVKVENMTGHKFPSGIPIRSAWLHLAVKNAAGKVIFESGRPRADGGITANNADEAGYEPHYDVITSPDQVQIYEGIMRDSDGAVTYTLLRAASYAKDNRLLPAGFDKASAAKDIAVYGNAAGDENFIGGADVVTYRVNKPEQGRGPWTVAAELLYSSLSTPFLHDLQKDRAEEGIADFIRFNNRTAKESVIIDTITAPLD